MRLSPKYLVTVALLLLFAGCGEKVQERTMAFDVAVFSDDGKPFQFGKEYKGGTCRILEFISSKNMFFFDGFGYSDEIPKGYDYGSGVSMEKGSLSYSFGKKIDKSFL